PANRNQVQTRARIAGRTPAPHGKLNFAKCHRTCGKWAALDPLERSVRANRAVTASDCRMGCHQNRLIFATPHQTDRDRLERCGKNGCASRPLLDPGKSIADARRLPGCGWRRLTARRRDVSSLSLSQDDLPASRGNSYTATFHEDPNHASARTAKKTRAPDSNESRRAPGCRRQSVGCRSSIEQHWSILKRDPPTRFNEKAVDLHAAQLPEPHRRVTSELHTQPRFRPGPHLIRDEDGRGMREPATLRC